MKMLCALLFAISLNSAFASVPKITENGDRKIRSSLAEMGIEVVQKDLIDTGFGLQSITSAPIAIVTLGFFRLSNVRIKVKVGNDNGTVVCKAEHDNLSEQLMIYNCRLKNIANIPETVIIDEETGYLSWPQRMYHNVLLIAVQQQSRS